MKKFIAAGVALFAALFIFGAGAMLFSPSTAQKKYAQQWEYAAITAAYIPAAAENQATLTGIAGVCFLETSGCRNEEIKGELIYAKFLQDFKLENTANSKSLAFNRAKELAYTRAVAKLGLEGWEIIGQPPVNFDVYIENQGAYSIAPGNKEIKPNVYFKRLIQ